MIEAKMAGKEVVQVAEEEKPVVDIMTALKQSIEQAKAKKKPMEKAKGRKETCGRSQACKRKETKSRVTASRRPSPVRRVGNSVMGQIIKFPGQASKFGFKRVSKRSKADENPAQLNLFPQPTAEILDLVRELGRLSRR